MEKYHALFEGGLVGSFALHGPFQIRPCLVHVGTGEQRALVHPQGLVEDRLEWMHGHGDAPVDSVLVLARWMLIAVAVPVGFQTPVDVAVFQEERVEVEVRVEEGTREAVLAVDDRVRFGAVTREHVALGS